jgi:hypothetical protein
MLLVQLPFAELTEIFNRSTASCPSIVVGRIERTIRLPADAQEVSKPAVPHISLTVFSPLSHVAPSLLTSRMLLFAPPQEGIQAKCENGLLHICVPRLPKKRPVDIQ